MIDHTREWPSCDQHRELNFLYCVEHLGAEIDRWLKVYGKAG